MVLNQLIIVLIALITAVSAFVLPFTYTFIKNLYTAGYEEFNEIIKLLKKLKEEGKSQKKSKNIENLKERVKCTKGQLDNFNNKLRKIMYILFGMWIFSVIFGGCVLSYSSPNFVYYMKWVVAGILIVEILMLIGYIRVFIRYKPLELINDLRNKKIRINLEVEKIDSNFASVFADNNNIEKEELSKMKKWTTYQLIAAGSIGALMIIFDTLGAVVSAAVGILGAGGVINTFIEGALFVLCCLVIRKFGAATITGFIFSVLALPLPVLGTPGFLPKILIGTSTGLAIDVIYFLLKKNERAAAIVIGAGKAMIVTFEVIGLGLLFSIPGIEKSIELLRYAIPTFLLMGGIGGYVGYIIFSKLRNTAVVRRIQGS